MKYYKVLLNNHSCVRSIMDWTKYLPHDGEPGKWLSEIDGEIKLCERGYHVTDTEHLVDWIFGNQLFECEIDGDIVAGDDKYACRKMRLLRQVDMWNDRTLRLFAVWCAREALKLVKEPDPRSVNAVDVAERYANGNATGDELHAAWAAARAAAWDAARDAARDTAWAAARAAAWAAARAAARAAQSKKLIEMLGLNKEAS
jgi:hypothetical protein